MKLTTKEIALFSVLGALMFASKKALEALPNIHILALFIITFTVVYRAKAFIPVFIYVFLDGLFSGFGTWWIPYLYLWPVLVAVTLLVPQKLSQKFAVVCYIAIAFLHGLLFGLLYAPFQALVFGLDFKGTVAWIINGLPFDVIHAISNAVFATLVIPLSKLLKKAS